MRSTLDELRAWSASTFMSELLVVPPGNATDSGWVDWTLNSGRTVVDTEGATRKWSDHRRG